MDLTTNANGRHVSVIVRPRNDQTAPLQTTTDAMIKTWASNPWATALMMQYASVPQATLLNRLSSPMVSKGIIDSSLPSEQSQQQQFLTTSPLQLPQQTPTFGALLKAAIRNRNNSSNAGSSLTGSNTISASDHQQPPSAAPNRMSYPREFKLLVIGYYFKNGQNKYRTCKEFQITKSMLNGWLQKMDKIQQSRPGSLKSGRSGRKPQFPQVESELYNIYLSYVAQGKKVGNRWLRDTAKCIAQRRCSTDELNGMCQFSERWLCNFKKRFGINLAKDWHDKPSESDDSPTTEQSKSESTNDGKPDSDDTELISESQASPDTTVDGEKLHIVMDNTKMIPANDIPFQPPQKNSRSTLGYEPGKRGRKVQFPQVERALFKKLQDKQIDGTKVSNRWLQDEARRLAVELCPQLFTDTFKSARCMFSEHWLHNFKKRYGITLKPAISRSDIPTAPKSPESPLNLTISEPVSSSDDIEKNRHCQQIDQQRMIDSDKPTNGTGHMMDDLPTMVPLPMMRKPMVPQPINFAEWYSKIITMQSDPIDSDEANIDQKQSFMIKKDSSVIIPQMGLAMTDNRQ